MIKKLSLLISILGLASCSVHQVGSGQNEGDPNIDCSGLVGQSLHRCSALATGWSETVMRNFDERCLTQGQHMGLGRATGANRQIVDCRQGRAIVEASNRQQGIFRTPDVSLDPNSPKAVSFGVKLTAQELAKKQNIPDRGGIKQRAVVVIPSSNEWRGVVARAGIGRAALHIKPIYQGDTIAKAHRYASEGNIQLVDGRIPVLSMSKGAKTSACKIILDGTGEPITIREGETGINRYAFTHFINEVQFQYGGQESQVSKAESAWKKQAGLLDGLKARIVGNRAHQNGQCVLVKQRAIPPAPKRIDPKLIEMNAHGACVNLIGSRFTEEQVIDALESAGQWNITKDYQSWTFGEKMSCAAGVTVPEFESLKTRAIDWFAPNLGKEYFRKAVRADIDRCIGQVKRRCDDGYSAWAARKRQIINEPRQLKSQCLTDKRKLATYDYSAYNEAKRQLGKALKGRDEAFDKQKSFDQNTLLPFTDKRTYCQLE